MERVPVESEILDISTLTGQGAAYEAVFDGDGAARKKEKKDSAYAKGCRHVEQLLWKTEVDLENIEDIYHRTLDNAKQTATPFNVFVADMRTSVESSMAEA